MHSLTLKNTFPPVTLSPPARTAIREFAHRHKSTIDAAALEAMAAKQAAEFCLVRGTERWFARSAAHPFRALELARDRTSAPVDVLELVVIINSKAFRLEVTTLEDHPLPDDYYVQRVILESQTIIITT